MRSVPTHVAASLAFALSVAGCSGPAGDPAQGGSGLTGTATVLLTATPLTATPPDVTHAVVTITQIGLQGTNGLVVLSSVPVTTDLLTLSSDLQTLVAGATIPAGTYSQLRFVISGAFLEVGGVVYASSPDYEGLPAGTVVGGELQMPSYGQSGLKVILPGGLVVPDGGATTLLVEFDVSQSFGHAAGGTDKWVMHPVVKASPIEATTGDLVVTLALGEGVALPTGVTLGSFSAVITPPGGAGMPFTESGGIFSATFSDLAPGDYTATITGPAGVTFTTVPALPPTATVTAGMTTQIDFLLASAI
jgi:hypothetical protein